MMDPVTEARISLYYHFQMLLLTAFHLLAAVVCSQGATHGVCIVRSIVVA